MIGTVSCGPATRDLAAAGAQQVGIADPAPGTVNVALVGFDLDAGTPPPVLRVLTPYPLSGGEAFLAGIAPDPTLPNGFVGLAAIASFPGPGTAKQRRAQVKVAASQEFSIKFAGNATYGAADVASYPAVLSHGPWQVSWLKGREVPAALGGGTGALDQILALLRGAPAPQLLAALSGPGIP